MSYNEFKEELAKLLAKAKALQKKIDDPEPSALWQDQANIHIGQAIVELRKAGL